MIYFIFILCTAFVCARLFIIAYNGTAADEVLSGQYTRRLDLASRDGFIFDRYGELLSHNESGYVVFINPANADSLQYGDIARELSESSGMRESHFYDKLYSKNAFVVTTDKKVEVEYATSFVRYEKNMSDFLCHILGYDDIDGNGVCGVRRAYGDYLDSVSGTAFVRYEADATGGIIENGVFSVYDSMYSEKTGLLLTLDKEIQAIAELAASELLDMGAIVITDINSGEILASVSAPSFYPDRVSDYLESEKGEFVNRAFMSYTPGSVFKTVVACAALENDIGLFELEYECTGAIDLSGETIPCHDRDGHGKIAMKEAFANSCNPYFINLALQIGIDEILSMAKSMGVCTYDNINLLSCAAGNLPTDRLFLPANVANTAVGQGEVLLTPVQVCSVMSCAVSGEFIMPSIVKGYINLGELTDTRAEYKNRVLSHNTTELMREMLSYCVSDGTGSAAQSELVSVGGKTATAQSGQYKDGREVIHRWFAGVFPMDEPQYSICVLCDGNGSSTVSPASVFKSLCERLVQ